MVRVRARFDLLLLQRNLAHLGRLLLEAWGKEIDGTHAAHATSFSRALHHLLLTRVTLPVREPPARAGHAGRSSTPIATRTR